MQRKTLENHSTFIRIDFSESPNPTFSKRYPKSNVLEVKKPHNHRKHLIIHNCYNLPVNNFKYKK